MFLSPGARARPLPKNSWTNRRVSKTGTYTIARSDNGATIALGGNSFYTVIFSAATNYAQNHINVLINEDKGRGKQILPVYTFTTTAVTIATGSQNFTVSAGLNFPSDIRWRVFSRASPTNYVAGSFASYSSTTLNLSIDTAVGSAFSDGQIAPETILWPLQTLSIYVDNGLWMFNRPYWIPQKSVTINVDPTNGNNSNDGLATTTGAVKTIGRAVQLFYTDIQCFQSNRRVIDCGGNTIQEFVDLEHVPPGGGVFTIQNLTWKPGNSSYCVQVGDWVGLILQSVTMDGNGTTAPIGYITMHQHAVVDTFASFAVTTGGLSGSMFTGDGLFKINVNNGMTITNSGGSCAGFVYDGRNPLSQWNINNTHTFSGTPVIGRWAYASECSVMQFQGNVAFSGAITISPSVVTVNGVIANFSGATLPGGTPTGTTGGLYVTTITS